MTTRATLIRKLRNRIPDIDALDIQSARPFVFVVSLSVKGQRTFDDVVEEAKLLLQVESTAGVGFEVVPYSSEDASRGETPPVQYALAGYSCDQSSDGLRRGLVSAVHDLAKVFVEERKGDRATFYVAREDGSAPQEFLERVRIALEVIGYAGLPFDVKAVDPANHRHADMRRAGFAVPARDVRLVRYTEEDESLYAERIRRLVDDKADNIAHIDDPGKSSVYLTVSGGKLEIGAMLPLYDRMFVELPMSRDGTSYFEQSFGLREDEFIELCKAGAVLPVFARNLGHYPEAVWRRWVEDPSLPLVSPRDADFLAMRHLWSSVPHIKQFRSDRESLQGLDAAMRNLLSLPGPEFRQSKWMYDLFGWIRHGAEEFEGIAFHRGCTALSSLSAGGAGAHLLSAMAPELIKDKAAADTIAIEGFAASQHIATAQAFGASLFDALVLNEVVLKAIVPMFQEAVEVNGKLRVRQLTELIKALEIHHSPRIPVREYLQVMTQSETVRVRSIVQELLGGGSSDVSGRELRDRVVALNKEVAHIDKKDLRVSTVDVLGDVVSGGAAMTSGAAYGMATVAKLLGGSLLSKLVTQSVDSTLDGTAGSTIDRVRGALNGVSPHAIRLFRLRGKLRR